MLEITLGVILFTLIILILVGVILFAKSRLVSTGHVDIVVNNEKHINAPVGEKLLQALAEAHLFVSSAYWRVYCLCSCYFTFVYYSWWN